MGMVGVACWAARAAGELPHNDHIHGKRDEFACSLGESVDFAFGGPVFDCNVLVLDIAQVAQALPEVVPKGLVVDDADTRHPDKW
jgi:hypothetical protein